jgi:hypothetical protein
MLYTSFTLLLTENYIGERKYETSKKQDTIYDCFDSNVIR